MDRLTQMWRSLSGGRGRKFMLIICKRVKPEDFNELANFTSAPARGVHAFDEAADRKRAQRVSRAWVEAHAHHLQECEAR